MLHQHPPARRKLRRHALKHNSYRERGELHHGAAARTASVKNRRAAQEFTCKQD